MNHTGFTRKQYIVISAITFLLLIGSTLSKECTGKLSIWQYYFTRSAIPVDCDDKEEESGCWGAWSAWSACNSPLKCGNCGQRQRLRKCKHGDKCSGDDKEVASCGEKICESGSPCCSGNHLAYSTKDKFYCEAD